MLIARTEAKYLVSVLNLLRFPSGSSHRRNLSLKRCRKPQTSNVLKEANSKLKTVKKSCLEIALVLWNATSEVKMEARSEISMKFCIKYGSAGFFHDWVTYPTVTPECRNFKIFISPRFYVKSILCIVEVQKLPFLPF